MFDFISRHIKLIGIAAILIIVVMIVALVLMGRKTPTNTPTEVGLPNSEGLIIDSNNRYLTNENLSKEDKYLLLLGQTLTEEYGTIKLGNTINLVNVQNQATEQFAAEIQNKINTLDKSENIITIVDPNTINLNRTSESEAEVTMNATSEDKNANQTNNYLSTVSLIQQNGYWLVQSITFENR